MKLEARECMRHGNYTEGQLYTAISVMRMSKKVISEYVNIADR
jgi:hypothetical protein